MVTIFYINYKFSELEEGNKRLQGRIQMLGNKAYRESIKELPEKELREKSQIRLRMEQRQELSMEPRAEHRIEPRERLREEQRTGLRVSPRPIMTEKTATFSNEDETEILRARIARLDKSLKQLEGQSKFPGILS